MPLIAASAYRPRWVFRNAHASTIFPSALRKVLAVPFVRQRLELADGDFLDLDWSRCGAERVAVLLHGLEGNTSRPYVRGMERAKAAALPGVLDAGPLARVHNIVEFDDVHTAPLHGFADAADYYARSSSLDWLPRIAVPTLLLTAANDPILGRHCYPVAEAEASSRFHLEVTPWGGHVGFHLPGPRYYSERRAVAFLHEACDD